jgi:hypothetical protein
MKPDDGTNAEWQYIERTLLSSGRPWPAVDFLLHRRSAALPGWFELCARAFGLICEENQQLADRLLNSSDTLRRTEAPLLGSFGRTAGLTAKLAGYNTPGPQTPEEWLLFGALAELTASHMGLTSSATLDSVARSALKSWRGCEHSTRVRVPVLFDDTDGGKALLVVQLLPWPADAPAGEPSQLFVAGPGSCLLEADVDFREGLRQADKLLSDSLQGLADFRLVWDLVPGTEDKSLHQVSGASISASFALVGLGLCVDQLDRFDPLCKYLRAIDWHRALVSARLRDDKGLDAVSGLGKKLQALRNTHRQGGLMLRDVFVAKKQTDLTPEQGAHHCGDIIDLAKEVARVTNVERNYGTYPDVEACFREAGRDDSKSYAHYFERPWLNERVAEAIRQLPDGGLVILEADALFGKTAWALSQIRHAQQDEPAPFLIDGWAIARGNHSETLPRQLSGDAEKVTAQLDACVRHRLDLRFRDDDPARQFQRRDRWKALLEICSDHATERNAIVVLLLDGVDEAYEDIGEHLPTSWPYKVVLILAGRSSAFRNVGSGRPVREVLPTIAGETIRRHRENDLRRYIDERAKQIVEKHGRELSRPEREAIARACDGLFFVAADLLGDRPSLVSDLDAWSVETRSIPVGAREVLLRQIKRVEDAVWTLGKPREAVLPLLCWLALSNSDWSSGQICNALISDWRRYAAKSDLFQRAWAIAAKERLWADEEIAKEVLSCASDLLLPGRSDAEPLRFWHPFLRDTLRELARERGWAGPMHALWGLLCENVFEPATSLSIFGQSLKRSSSFQRYALLNGPWHLGQAARVDPRRGHSWWNSAESEIWRQLFWEKSAQRLLDIRPADNSDGGELGYLQRLFEGNAVEADVRAEAWSTLGKALASLLGSKSVKAEGNLSELKLMLRSLRHVLVDQHELILEGTLPLVAALFNRMSGKWGPLTDWGKLLCMCTSVLRRPWLRAVKPSPALALGPLAISLPSRATCMATSADGTVIAVGMKNGDLRIWSQSELRSGQSGQLIAAGPSGESTSSISIIGQIGKEPWVVAVGSIDGRVRLTTCSEARFSSSQGRDATRHINAVTSVVLEPVGNNTSWMLASMDKRGDVQLSFSLGNHSEGETLHSVRVEFLPRVQSIGLKGCRNGDEAILALGCRDGTTHIAVISLPEIRDNTDWAPSTVVATHHTSGVTCLCLLTDEAGEHWTVASGGEDGDVLVSWSSLHASGSASSGRRDVISVRHCLVSGRPSKQVTGIALVSLPGDASWAVASASANRETRFASGNYMPVTDSQDEAGPRGKVVACSRGSANSVVMLLDSLTKDVWIATATYGGDVSIARSFENRGVESIDETANFGRVVTQHHSSANLVALVSRDSQAGPLLISAGDDQRLLVTAPGDSVADVGVSSDAMGQVGTRHSQPVSCVSLAEGANGERWVLATGSFDGTVRVAVSAEVDSRTGVDWISPQGSLAYHRESDAEVRDVSLLATKSGFTWAVASADSEGSVRLATYQSKAKSGTGEQSSVIINQYRNDSKSVAVLAGPDQEITVVWSAKSESLRQSEIRFSRVLPVGTTELRGTELASCSVSGNADTVVTKLVASSNSQGSHCVAYGVEEGSIGFLSSEMESNPLTWLPSALIASNDRAVSATALMPDQGSWLFACGRGSVAFAGLVPRTTRQEADTAIGAVAQMQLRHKNVVESVALLSDGTGRPWLASADNDVVRLTCEAVPGEQGATAIRTLCRDGSRIYFAGGRLVLISLFWRESRISEYELVNGGFSMPYRGNHPSEESFQQSLPVVESYVQKTINERKESNKVVLYRAVSKDGQDFWAYIRCNATQHEKMRRDYLTKTSCRDARDYGEVVRTRLGKEPGPDDESWLKEYLKDNDM